MINCRYLNRDGYIIELQRQVTLPDSNNRRWVKQGELSDTVVSLPAAPQITHAPPIPVQTSYSAPPIPFAPASLHRRFIVVENSSSCSTDMSLPLCNLFILMQTIIMYHLI